MLNWFRRRPRPAAVDAVRDFVDTVEFVNVLLAREQAERDQTLGAARVGGSRSLPPSSRASA